MGKGAYMYGGLQQILGTDKRNPCFTVFCDGAESLLLFYGGELLERLPNDREHVQYKLMVAKLYNAGVKVRVLQELFEVSPKTMRRWGRTLEEGDFLELVHVFAGRRTSRKLTVEIQAFAKMRFSQIYPENRRSYSQLIRREIIEVFGVELSAESLRPIFGKLRKTIDCGSELCAKKGESTCDVVCPERAPFDADHSPKEAIREPKTCTTKNSYRKYIPLLSTQTEADLHFGHHLGVLLFSQVLLQVNEVGGESGWVLKQWLCSILLGALNIEQSKLLDLDGLSRMIGRTQKSRHPQRCLLAEFANSSVADKLYRLNAEQVGIDSCSDFYYDPHTKQYTGGMKILKGWCGSRHFADKALHMDFIHTATGHPVYISYDDNYADLRERYTTVISAMRSSLEIGTNRELTFVFDRGIYGQQTFNNIIKDPRLHIVTWEKNYSPGTWDDTAHDIKHYTMHRARNRANDLKTYTFEYQEEPWSTNTAMRLIRVRATNPSGRTIELGILTDLTERPASELIWLMFHRWLQENDFKYMEKHFGINQITSYASHSYEELAHHLEDRQVKSGEYKALQKERTHLRKKLKIQLYNEHRHPHKSPSRTEHIQTLTTADQILTQKIAGIDQQTSKLDTLIQNKYRKLNTASKKVYDALKLIARNAFYNALAPFKKSYDNYRDDHVIFRNLTHAPGLLTSSGNQLTATLHPTAPHPPARRKIIEELLEEINQTAPLLPDGSGRTIRFELGKREGIELATQNPPLTLN